MVVDSKTLVSKDELLTLLSVKKKNDSFMS